MQNVYLISFIFILFLLSGCSALQAPDNNSDSLPAAPVSLELPEEPEEPAEVEEGLQEELAALDRLGAWEQGRPEAAGASEPQYDFPVIHNKHVEFYLNHFQTSLRSHFSRWLSRSNAYLPFIRQELKEAGLPLDLAYLALIESGFNPSAYSTAQAAGLWQFIKGTGQNYGLRVDSWVDERRDPEKSTKAAIAYLTNLHNEFGDWYLAVAAYNAGEGKIGRGIAKYDTKDFWQLAGNSYLSMETKRYVPKLIAAIIIAKNPERYGFGDVEMIQPLQYELVEVGPMTSVAAVAAAGKIEVELLKKLNNELRKGITPPNDSAYQLKIPVGSRELVAKNLSRTYPVVSTDYKTHTVRRGETLSSICRRYSLNKTTLLKANNLRGGKLALGKRLRIPFQTTSYVLLKEGETPQRYFARTNSGGNMVLHQVKPGETLSRIATRYQVPAELIMQWNGLTSIHKIGAGQQLALYLNRKETGVVGAGTEEVAQITELKDNKKKVATSARRATRSSAYYQVRDGDSLWAIAQRFKVSAQELKKWNNLKSNSIKPGIKLLIKKS